MNYLYLVLLIGMIVMCIICAKIYSANGTTRNQRIFINVFLVLCFSLLMALRPDYVPDTLSYIEIFDNIKTDISYGFDILGEAERVEYGFLYLIKFFKIFSNNVKIFFFLVCLLSISLFLYGMNKIVKYLTGLNMCVPAVMSAYIAYFGIYYNGIVIRQGLAMALCIMSFSYILNKKYIKSGISWLLAFLFHRLSFIFVFIIVAYYILRNLNISQFGYFIITLICLICGVSGIGYKVNEIVFSGLLKLLNILGLESAYAHYLTNLSSQSSGFPLYLVFQIICGILLVYILGTRKYMKNFYNIYFIGIVIMTIFVGTFAINRGADYFLMFSLIIISCYFVNPSKNAKLNKIVENNVAVEYNNGINMQSNILKVLSVDFIIIGYFLAVTNIIFPDLISLSFLH